MSVSKDEVVRTLLTVFRAYKEYSEEVLLDIDCEAFENLERNMIGAEQLLRELSSEPKYDGILE